MKKRILSLLVLCIMTTLFPANTVFAESGGTCGDNIIWSHNIYTGVLTISGTGDMPDWEYYSGVPWYSEHNYITSIVIRDGVTSVGRCAFMCCQRAIDVTIPDSVTSIGDYAFYACEELTGITIPYSVVSVGCSVFYDCTSLASITVSENNTKYSSDSCGVLYDKNKKTLLQYPPGSKKTEFSIPKGVTSIDDYAFHGCTNLLNVILPDSVTTIDDWSFHHCTSLENITIPDSVTSIGRDAFRCCTSLKSITLGGVTSVGKNAFYGCDRLESITMGNSVTSVGIYAFYGCLGLTDVYYCGSKAAWEKIEIGVYNECLTGASIHYKDVSFDKANKKITVNSKNDISGAVLIVSKYSGDTLLDVKASGISLNAGDNTVCSPVTDFSGADTIKIYVWNSLSGMIPICKNEIVNLNQI